MLVGVSFDYHAGVSEETRKPVAFDAHGRGRVEAGRIPKTRDRSLALSSPGRGRLRPGNASWSCPGQPRRSTWVISVWTCFSAIDVYLGIAYPSGPPPESVRRRLEWPDDADASVLLTHPPFERVGKEAAKAGAIFALRLGNASLSAHEAPDPALAQRGGLPALGQHPRPGPRSIPPRPTPRPSARSRPRTSGSRRRSSRPGTRRGCRPSSATSATTSRAAATPSGPATPGARVRGSEPYGLLTVASSQPSGGRTAFDRARECRGSVNSKVEPRPGVLSKLDRAAVQLDERLDQAEAQADAALAELEVARGVVQRVVAGEERLEEVRAGRPPRCRCRRRSPGTARASVAVDRLGDDPDRAAVGRELDRVDEQVRQDVGELARVDLGGAEVRLRARGRPSGRGPRGTAGGRRRPADQRARGRSARRSRVSSNWSARSSLSIRSTVAASRLRGELDALDPGALAAGGRRRPSVIFQSSVMPRTTATGVFSSWLATSMKADLSRLASASRCVRSPAARPSAGASRRSGRAARPPGGRRPAARRGPRAW